MMYFRIHLTITAKKEWTSNPLTLFTFLSIAQQRTLVPQIKDIQRGNVYFDRALAKKNAYNSNMDAATGLLKKSCLQTWKIAK